MLKWQYFICQEVGGEDSSVVLRAEYSQENQCSVTCVTTPKSMNNNIHRIYYTEINFVTRKFGSKIFIFMPMLVKTPVKFRSWK